MPVHVLESTTFRLRIPYRYDESPRVAHYKIDYDDSIRHPVLRHRYVTLGDDKRDEQGGILSDNNRRRMRTSYYGHKYEELQESLNKLTMIELTKLPADDRPGSYAALLSSGLEGANDISISRDFDPPDTWLFYNGKFIAFLEKAWKVQQQIDARDEARRKAEFEKHP